MNTTQKSRRDRLFGFLDGYTIRARAACNSTAKKGRTCTSCKLTIAAGERYRYHTSRITFSYLAEFRDCGVCVRAAIVGRDAYKAQKRGQRYGQPFATRVFFTILREAGVTFHKGGSCNAGARGRDPEERCTGCDEYRAFMSRPLAEVAARI
jgi:hypothetical protein